MPAFCRRRLRKTPGISRLTQSTSLVLIRADECGPPRLVVANARRKAASQGTGGKITITGLTPGTILWVRVATVGSGGQLGAWSDPAKIVVA